MRKEIILQTAFDLVNETGVENLSMRKLAKEVGCAPSTMYHHFADKNDLLNEVYLFALQKANMNYEGITYEDFLRTVLKQARENHQYHEFTHKYHAASFITPETQKVIDAHIENNKNMWRRFKQDGEIKCYSPKVFHMVFHGVISSVASQESVSDEVIEELVDLILYGVSTNNKGGEC